MNFKKNENRKGAPKKSKFVIDLCVNYDIDEKKRKAPGNSEIETFKNETLREKKVKITKK